MALDRSKFKATVVSQIVETDKELASALGRKDQSYTNYIRLEEGNNLIRIYPSHPEEDGGDGNFAVPKVTVFLPMMKPERDSNGNEIYERGQLKMKESSQSVFNSRIHGNTPKDLVEEYVRYALEKFQDQLQYCQDPAQKGLIEDKIDKVRGNYKKKMSGLNYKQGWVMYVDRIVGETRTFGTLEIGVTIKKSLNQIAASLDTANGAIVTDPFTDINIGKAVNITYNKKALNPNDYYVTMLDTASIPTKMPNGTTALIQRTFPLTDEQLEEFEKVTPLAKRFKNCFTRRDFNLQLEGLQYFDQKNNIGLFEDNGFINIVEEIDMYYPEEEETQDENTSYQSQQVVQPLQPQYPPHPITQSNDMYQPQPIGGQYQPEQQYDESQQDMFDLMSRKELSDWAKSNKTGILIKPTMREDDIRNALRQWQSQKDIKTDIDEVLDNEPLHLQQQSQPQQPASPAPSSNVNSRLEQMKARMKK